MGDLTEYISYSELRPHGAVLTWKPASEVQDKMLQTLAKNIQIILNRFNCHVMITSGVRDFSDYDRLRKTGYNPSPISDHFCGNIIPIDPMKQPLLFKKFGSEYKYSVGAADTIPMHDMNEVYFEAVQANKRGDVNFGQIIHERDPDKKKEWIHFSNNPALFFSEEECKLLNRPKYLFTIDGGKKYQVFNG